MQLEAGIHCPQLEAGTHLIIQFGLMRGVYVGVL